MKNVIWKSFKLNELFEFATSPSFALKDYKIYDEQIDNSILVVSSSKEIKGQFISKEDIPKDYPTYKNSLTINRNGSIGYCRYFDTDFIIPTGDTYTLINKNEKFKNMLEKDSYSFLSIIITYIFTSKTYGYQYKVNIERFDREIILLPCLEVAENEEFIWEENGKYYTLAVEYIKKLMEEAKELREQKTIRLYEAEKKKYEAEYIKEKKDVVWKGYELGSLFSWSSRKDLSLKDYNLFEEYSEGYVEVITGSKNDDNRYIDKNELPPNYPIYQNCLCLNCNGSIGYCFYYKNEIVSPTSSVHILIHKYEKFKNIMNETINQYLSKTITTIFAEKMYNRTSCLIDNHKFDREIILLPCLEVAENEEFIWEENGKYYTLATNFISYIYLQGKCNYYQKLIDTYTYKY